MSTQALSSPSVMLPALRNRVLARGFATNAVAVDGFTGAVGNTPLVSLCSSFRLG